MTAFLGAFTIKTFEKLISKATSLQGKLEYMRFVDKDDKPKPVRGFEKRTGVVATVDKGKQPIQIQPEPSQPAFQFS